MKKHLLTNSKSRGGITKLNSNAFTLIELLAIIVILAIIAVITVPIILNIIENSHKGAASDSAYGYKDSVNKFYIAELQNHNKLKLDGTYTVKSDGSLEPTEDNTFGFGDSEYGNSLNVAVSGTIPSSGKLRYSNNVLNAGCVVIGDYKVTFGTDGKVDGTVKGDCTTYEFPTSISNGQSENNENNEQNSGGNVSIPTIATCPDCVFGTFTGLPEEEADLDDYTSNYEELEKNIFIGVKFDDNIIEKIYVCGIEGESTYCLEGFDAATNESIISSVYDADALSIIFSDELSDEEKKEQFYTNTDYVLFPSMFNEMMISIIDNSNNYCSMYYDEGGYCS